MKELIFLLALTASGEMPFEDEIFYNGVTFDSTAKVSIPADIYEKGDEAIVEFATKELRSFWNTSYTKSKLKVMVIAGTSAVIREVMQKLNQYCIKDFWGSRFSVAYFNFRESSSLIDVRFHFR